MNKVSVIVPNYNHAAFLAQRIDSILNQTYQNFEIIILDDCSRDNSKQIIETYRGNEKIKQIVYNSTNSGSTFAQWQNGIELAQGDFIWIAESDDIAEPTFLETVVQLIINKPKIDFVFTRSYDIDENGIRLGLSYAQLNWNNQDLEIAGKEFVVKYLLENCTIPNASAVVFRKNKFKNSFLSSDFKLCGDWLFYTNILEYCNLYYVSKPLNNHRFHTQTVRNSLNNSIGTLKEKLEIARNIFVKYQLDKNSFSELEKFHISFFIRTTKMVNIFSTVTVKGLFSLLGVNIKKYIIVFQLLIYKLKRKLLDKNA